MIKFGEINKSISTSALMQLSKFTKIIMDALDSSENHFWTTLLNPEKNVWLSS